MYATFETKKNQILLVFHSNKLFYYAMLYKCKIKFLQSLSSFCLKKHEFENFLNSKMNALNFGV